MTKTRTTQEVETYDCQNCGRPFLTWQGRNGHQHDCNPTVVEQ